MLEKEHRDHQQTRRKDDRHHAGLIDPQRQALSLTTMDSPPTNVLGTLNRDPPLALCDHDHPEDDRDKDQRKQKQFFDSRVRSEPHPLFKRRLQQLGSGLRHSSEDTGHDQQADAIADSVGVDLFTNPHQKDRSGGHGDRPHHVPGEGVITVENETATAAEHATREGTDPEVALEQTDDNCRPPSPFVDLLPTRLALFLQFLQPRHDTAQELENDRGGDIGHDAQAEDRTVADVRSRKQGHDLHDLADALVGLHVLQVFLQDLLVDEWQRDPESHAIDA